MAYIMKLNPFNALENSKVIAQKVLQIILHAFTFSKEQTKFDLKYQSRYD